MNFNRVFYVGKLRWFLAPLKEGDTNCQLLNFGQPAKTLKTKTEVISTFFLPINFSTLLTPRKNHFPLKTNMYVSQGDGNPLKNNNCIWRATELALQPLESMVFFLPDLGARICFFPKLLFCDILCWYFSLRFDFCCAKQQIRIISRFLHNQPQEDMNVSIKSRNSLQSPGNVSHYLKTFGTFGWPHFSDIGSGG